MFDNLSNKLESAFKTLKGQGSITEINVAETLKEVRRALLDADVSFNTAKQFTNTVKERRDGWVLHRECFCTSHDYAVGNDQAHKY